MAGRRTRARGLRLVRRRQPGRLRAEARSARARPHAAVAQPAAELAHRRRDRRHDQRHRTRRPAQEAHLHRGRPLQGQDLAVGCGQRDLRKLLGHPHGRRPGQHRLLDPEPRRGHHRRRPPLGPRRRSARAAGRQRLQHHRRRRHERQVQRGSRLGAQAALQGRSAARHRQPGAPRHPVRLPDLDGRRPQGVRRSGPEDRHHRGRRAHLRGRTHDPGAHRPPGPVGARELVRGYAAGRAVVAGLHLLHRLGLRRRRLLGSRHVRRRGLCLPLRRRPQPQARLHRPPAEPAARRLRRATPQRRPLGSRDRHPGDESDPGPVRPGLLVTAYGTTVVLATLPLTFLATRLPRRPLVLVLLSILVVATLAATLAPGYRALFAARVVTALSQAMFWPVAAPLAVGLYPPEQRGRAASVVFTGGSLGPMLGVPLGTWLGQLNGWRFAFGTIAGLELLALLAALFAVPASPAHREQAQRGDDPSLIRYVQVLLITILTVAGLYAFFTYTASFLTVVTAFPAA